MRIYRQLQSKIRVPHNLVITSMSQCWQWTPEDESAKPAPVRALAGARFGAARLIRSGASRTSPRLCWVVWSGRPNLPLRVFGPIRLTQSPQTTLHGVGRR